MCKKYIMALIGLSVLFVSLVQAEVEYRYQVKDRLVRLRIDGERAAVQMGRLAGPEFTTKAADVLALGQVERVNTGRGIVVFRRLGDKARKQLEQKSEMLPVLCNDAAFWRVPVGQVIVRFQAGATQAMRDQALARHDLVFDRVIDGLPGAIVADARGWEHALDVIDAVQREPGVVWAEPDFISQVAKRFTPNDPRFTDQWHLDNQGQFGTPPHYDCGAAMAWNVQTGIPSIVVGVLDDAVQANHPDLQPSVVPGGYDFVDSVSDPSPKDPNPDEPENHGTAVAGVAVAAGNNGIGVAGAGFGCGLLPIRMLDGSEAQHAQALLYASTNAHVLNNSWGYPLPQVVHDALDLATTKGPAGKGCLIVFALGNYTMTRAVSDDPASVPSVLAVGINNDLMRRTYADYGLPLDLTANSDGGLFKIGTTDRTDTSGYNTNSTAAGGDYCEARDMSGFGGTSSASPLAAGIAALAYSKYPNAHALRIRKLLEESVDQIPTLISGAGYNQDSEWSPLVGYGALNAYKAVTLPLPDMDSNEPNNNAGAATEIFNARMDYGSIEPSGDTDWYRIAIATTSDVISTTVGSTNTLVCLYNSGQSLLGSSNGMAGVRYTCDPGNYYIQVSALAGGTVPAYGIDVSTYNYVDTHEPNNSFNSATTVSTWSHTVHTIWPAGDVDMISFQVASNNTMVALETYGFGGDTKMTLYNAGQTQIGQNDDSPFTYFSLIMTNLAAGTYYAAVEGVSNSVVRAYSLQVRTTTSDPFEPDNSPAQAAEFPSGQTQVRTIYPATNADWAKITLTTNNALLAFADWENYRLTDDTTFTNRYPSLFLALYNASTNLLREVRYNYNTSGAALYTNNLAPGVYYIKANASVEDPGSEASIISWYNLNCYVMPVVPRMDVYPTNQNVGLCWQGDRAMTYSIDQATTEELKSGTWRNITNIPGDFGEMSFTVTPGTATARVYRVRHSKP